MQSPQPTQDGMSSLQRYILSTAKIAGIAAITALLSSLVAIIGIFKLPSQQIPTSSNEGFGDAETQQALQSFTYLQAFIALVITVLVFYFLFRFSSLAKTGITQNNPAKLTAGLQSLGGYFKTWGIIMFLFLILCALSLLGTAFGG